MDPVQALNEFFRILPLSMYVLFFLLIIVFKSGIAFFLLAGLLLNGALWFFLSRTFPKILPLEIVTRPNTERCAFIDSDRLLPKTSGFPSGHCQSMGFVATWLILCAIHVGTPASSLVPFAAVLTASVCFMAYSRVKHYRCHQWIQAIAGSIIGIATAFPVWWLSERVLAGNRD